MRWNRFITKKFPIIMMGTLCLSFSYGELQASADETSEQLIERKQQVEEEIQLLNDQIEQLQQLIEQEIELYNETTHLIKENEQQAKALQKKMNERSTIIEERLKVYQTNQSNFSIYLDALLGADNFSDAFGRVTSLTTIIDADQQMIEAFEKDEQQLAAVKEELLYLEQQQQERFKQLQQQETDMQLLVLENEANVLKLQEEIVTVEEREQLEQERLAIEQHLGQLQFLTNTITYEPVENPPAQVDNIAQGIANAHSYLGMPYVWGGMHPSTSFDCSGLIQWSYGQAGITIPRTSGEQFLASVKIDVKDMLPGDLVFFSYGKGIQHVGIYVGDGNMLNSQNAGVVIEKISGWQQHLVGFARVVKR